MKNIILDAGLAYDFQTFEQLFDSSIYHILYIGEKDFCRQLQSSVNSNKVEYFPYEHLYHFKSHVFSEDELSKLQEVIDYVSRDKLTEELFDRTMSSYFFNYSTKNEVTIIQMTIAAYKFVLEYKPAFMLLYECCHNIRTWIVGRVCECLGIPVRYGRNGIFHWRNVYLEGMCKHPKLVESCKCIDGYSDWEYAMFKEIEARYSKGTEAIKPEYLEIMKEKKQKKLYSFWKDLKADWKRLDKVYYKNKCYKAYEKLCSSNLPEKFMVFYLHLQPERTTLPEGYGFTQQYKAISILNEVIPVDWSIVVKEHPATFYRYCTPSGRWPQLYKDIAALDKVILTPLETDTYMMMEKSKCVVTIAGTVCREALMMGKPALQFGIDVFFGNTPLGLHNYESEEGLAKFINDIESYSKEDIKLSFENYIHNCSLNEGAIGITPETKWNNATSIWESNRVSRFKLMKKILTTDE